MIKPLRSGERTFEPTMSAVLDLSEVLSGNRTSSDNDLSKPPSTIGGLGSGESINPEPSFGILAGNRPPSLLSNLRPQAMPTAKQPYPSVFTAPTIKSAQLIGV